jgi:hypothetical protein
MPDRYPRVRIPPSPQAVEQEEGPLRGPSSSPWVEDRRCLTGTLVLPLSSVRTREQLISEYTTEDREMADNLHESAHLVAPVAAEELEVLNLEALERVRDIDRLMEEHRRTMAVLAGLRDEAVRELAETTSVTEAAEALGVTRQAIYKAFQQRPSLTLPGDSMSSSLTQRKIEHLQKDIVRLQDRIAKETHNQVSLSERLSRARRQQAQTRSSGTARSREQEAVRFQREIVASQRRRADFEKQVSRKTEELHRNQSKLIKEQASERDRMLRQLKAVSEARERAAVPVLAKWRDHGPSNAGGEQSPSIDQLDVFISHAAEDKEEVARPLAEELRNLGLKVWYDEFELRVGDSLRRKVDSGLARSRFGIVVLSPDFFAKNWPQYELDGLVAKEMQDRRVVILPLWHKLSKDEVMRQSPSLADKVALSTSQFTIAELGQRLGQVMQRP